MERQKYRPSPCLSCTRVTNPANCENKLCGTWRQWFLQRWELIRSYPRYRMEQTVLHPTGICLGGCFYETPDRTRTYLHTDPCKDCISPRDLCTTPCKVRKAWETAKGEGK